MTIKTVKNGWKVDVTRKGNRFRRLVTTSRKDAEALEQAAIYALSNGLPIKSSGKTVEPTMGDLLKLTDSLRWSQHKSTSQSRTARNLFSLIGCENRPIKEVITQEEINKIELLCIDRKLSNATIDKYKSALRVMCDVAISNGYIDKMPTIRLSGKTSRREEFLTKDDEDKFLLEALESGYYELYDIAVFAIDTGARVSELLSLTNENYHDGAIILKDTKNGESRMIPLTTRANKIICDRLNNNTIFSINYEQIKYQWRVIRTRLGYNDEYCFHVCRHTFTTRLLMANNPTPMVALLTGHKSLNSLNKYVHANTEHLRNMINTLNQ